jgi:hypothetical protein
MLDYLTEKECLPPREYLQEADDNKTRAAESYSRAPLSPVARCQQSLVCRLAAQHPEIESQALHTWQKARRAAGGEERGFVGSRNRGRVGVGVGKEAGVRGDGMIGERGDTMIVYVTAPTWGVGGEVGASGVAEDNLDFMLALGLVHDPRCRSVLVV